MAWFFRLYGDIIHDLEEGIKELRSTAVFFFFFFEEAENIIRFVFVSNCKMNKAMVLSSFFAVYSIFL